MVHFTGRLPPTFYQLPKATQDQLAGAGDDFVNQMEDLRDSDRVRAKDVIPFGTSLLNLSSIICLIGDMLDGRTKPQAITQEMKEEHQSNCSSGSSRSSSETEERLASKIPVSIRSSPSGRSTRSVTCRCEDAIALMDLDGDVVRSFPDDDETGIVPTEVMDRVRDLMLVKVDWVNDAMREIMRDPETEALLTASAAKRNIPERSSVDSDSWPKYGYSEYSKSTSDVEPDINATEFSRFGAETSDIEGGDGSKDCSEQSGWKSKVAIRPKPTSLHDQTAEVDSQAETVGLEHEPKLEAGQDFSTMENDTIRQEVDFKANELPDAAEEEDLPERSPSHTIGEVAESKPEEKPGDRPEPSISGSTSHQEGAMQAMLDVEEEQIEQPDLETTQEASVARTETQIDGEATQERSSRKGGRLAKIKKLFGIRQ